jgi:hypothetical protein
LTDIQKAVESTSRLWEHLHIKTVGEIKDPFQAIGHVDVTCISRDSRAFELAQYKSAARRVLDWLVNGDTGLKSALHPDGIYHGELSDANISEFAKGAAHRATAFMMNRKQLRLLYARDRARSDYGVRLVKPSEDQKLPVMFGRPVIINDWTGYKYQDIWGLNLGPEGLHLLETGDRMRVVPTGDSEVRIKVLWDVGIGYKLSDDVTCMRQA